MEWWRSRAWTTGRRTARFTASLVGPVRPVLSYLAGQPVNGLLVEEPDLEDAFLDLYEEPR